MGAHEKSHLTHYHLAPVISPSSLPRLLQKPEAVSITNVNTGGPALPPFPSKTSNFKFTPLPTHPQPLLFLDLSVLQDIEYDNFPII